jgi:capsular polysaccharide biosynthesis protein
LGSDSGGGQDAPDEKLYVSRVGSSRSLDFEEMLERYLEAIGFVIL